MNKPHAFVSAEEMPGTNAGPLVAWVKHVDRSQVEVCVKSSEMDMSNQELEATIHLIVQGNMEACSEFKCPSHLECILDANKKPYCGCKNQCPQSNPSEEFCAVGDKTFTSMCQFYKEQCEAHGPAHQPNATKLYDGACVRKYIFFILHF